MYHRATDSSAQTTALNAQMPLPWVRGYDRQKVSRTQGGGIYLKGYDRISGEGFFDFLDPNKNGVAKAFDPNRNGVAKAFDPNRNGVARAFKPKNIAKAFDPVAKAFDPNRNGVKSGVEKIIKDTGAEKFVTKTLPSTLIKEGIPAVAEFVGSKFGVGKQARQLGEMGANEVSKVSGMGFKKGSPEMKAHMAKLRSMRKKK